MRWDEVEGFLLNEAEADLREGDEVRPCLVAFRGEEPLFVAFLRPGLLADALLEVLALACPLRADRLALSVSGRAWSLEDPIPPVLPGVGDLRERVVVLTTVAAGARPSSLVRCCDTPAAEALRLDGGEGWLVSMLDAATRTRMRASRAAVRAQASRCIRLGHLLGVSPELDAWLDGRCRKGPGRRRTSTA